MSSAVRNISLALIALLLIIPALWYLESARSGVDTRTVHAGSTPATLYQRTGEPGPLVVIAHGFAGSRQLMQAFSLTLAQAGYSVLAFDFEGHGRNPVPMSGDVTAIDGTTRLLVAETRRVLAAGRDLLGAATPAALLGHSMASDVIVRAALLERAAARPVDAVVGISMFSEAVTARLPVRLLIINGQWESRLRIPGLAALRQVDPNAEEGDTASADGVIRRAVVAPYVEHVGVLYSSTTLAETRAWLDDTFGRTSTTAIVRPGLPILALLLGIVLLFVPVVALLSKTSTPAPSISPRRFLLATLVPAALVPLVATRVSIEFLPVLVSDYLMVHLALYGGLQILLLRPWQQLRGDHLARAWQPLHGARRALAWQQLRRPGFAWATLALIVWGIGILGVALDRYVASFLPDAGRGLIILVLCIGTLPFMMADALITDSGNAYWWRRVLARLTLVASLLAAAALDAERLLFLLLIVPVLVLFLCVHGLMGRWIAQRCGPLPAGIGLGLCLAWALGVSFPLFDAAA